MATTIINGITLTETQVGVRLLDVFSFRHRVEHESGHGSGDIGYLSTYSIRERVLRYVPLRSVGVLLDSLLLLLFFLFTFRAFFTLFGLGSLGLPGPGHSGRLGFGFSFGHVVDGYLMEEK